MPPKTPRPELKLIHDRRRRLGLSLERAGKGAKITASYWKQIEDGKRELSGPRSLRTLARMAHAVGIEPQEMRAAGCHELADELKIVWELATAEEDRARRIAGQMLDAAEGLTDRERAILRPLVTDDIRTARDS